MQSLINELSKAPNQQAEDLEYLKKSSLPLALFGVGNYGYMTAQFLAEQEVSIDYYVVDSQYWRPDLSFMSYPVASFDDVLEKNKKLNVVVAVGGWREKQKEIAAFQSVEKSLFFDCCGAAKRFDIDYIRDNKEHFSMLFAALKDDLSREVLKEFLRALVTKRSESLVALNTPGERQYFPPFITLKNGEVFVDCGAFDGEDINVFINNISTTPPPRKVGKYTLSSQRGKTW